MSLCHMYQEGWTLKLVQELVILTHRNILVTELYFKVNKSVFLPHTVHTTVSIKYNLQIKGKKKRIMWSHNMSFNLWEDFPKKHT